MPCEIFTWGPGNKPAGIICSRGPRRRTMGPPCCACGRPSSLLCDGWQGDGKPWDAKGEPRTCDSPVCGSCAVQLRNLDVDLCPRCASWATPPGCLLASFWPARAGAPVHCLGALIVKAQLCVRHAVLFDHWLGFCGGAAIYANPQLNRAQRRDEHRRWLRSTAADELVRVLVARRAPLESGPADGPSGSEDGGAR